jgi:hypothetical protein
MYCVYISCCIHGNRCCVCWRCLGVCIYIHIGRNVSDIPDSQDFPDFQTFQTSRLSRLSDFRTSGHSDIGKVKVEKFQNLN